MRNIFNVIVSNLQDNRTNPYHLFSQGGMNCSIFEKVHYQRIHKAHHYKAVILSAQSFYHVELELLIFWPLSKNCDNWRFKNSKNLVNSPYNFESTSINFPWKEEFPFIKNIILFTSAISESFISQLRLRLKVSWLSYMSTLKWEDTRLSCYHYSLLKYTSRNLKKNL